MSSRVRQAEELPVCATKRGILSPEGHWGLGHAPSALALLVVGRFPPGTYRGFRFLQSRFLGKRVFLDARRSARGAPSE